MASEIATVDCFSYPLTAASPKARYLRLLLYGSVYYWYHGKASVRIGGESGAASNVLDASSDTRFSEDGFNDVSGLQVEDKDRDIVLLAERKGGLVHDAEPLL